MEKLITMFDREYQREKQAEGIAVSEAIVSGKCNDCPVFKRCTADRNFSFPFFTWCFQRKQQILKSWEK